MSVLLPTTMISRMLLKLEGCRTWTLRSQEILGRARLPALSEMIRLQRPTQSPHRQRPYHTLILQGWFQLLRQPLFFVSYWSTETTLRRLGLCSCSTLPTSQLYDSRYQSLLSRSDAIYLMEPDETQFLTTLDRCDTSYSSHSDGSVRHY